MTVETAFKNIADAIRERAGTSGIITPAAMPGAIQAIPAGGVELLTQSQWNALSTAEKQAKGLVAIEQAASGYNRGILVNGADYQPVGEILIYSNAAAILCEADYNMAIDNGRWGVGYNKPYATGCTIESESLYAPVAASDARLYVDLGAANTAYTAYVVMKLRSPGAFTRLLCALQNRSGGGGMLLYGATINVSSWANDTSTGYPSNQYHAMAIKWGGSNDAGGIVYGGSWIQKPPANSGQYVTIARSDIDAGTVNAEPGNADVKFFGVVSGAEDLTVIQSNLERLSQLYIAA